MVRCIKALKTIERGEEIFANYGYDPDSDFSPRWFRKAFRDFSNEVDKETGNHLRTCKRSDET